MPIVQPLWRHGRYIRAILDRPNRRGPVDLIGDRVLVSGGSNGIGAALVSELVAAGASVVSVDVVGPEREVDGVESILGDVRTFDFSRLQPFDLVIANAGVVDSSPDGRLGDAEIDRLVGTNLIGLIRTLDAPKTEMARAIVISSHSAVRAEPAGIVYGATKAAALNYGFSFGATVPTTVAIVGITATRLFEAEAAQHGRPVPDLGAHMADPADVARKILQGYCEGRECIVTDDDCLRDVAAFSHWIASAGRPGAVGRARHPPTRGG